jgi:ABC-2 type transport system ATP-binding protein
MSKGMKQKTAIAAALMGEKDILILDEPTTGLDPLMRDAFLEMMHMEKDKGHTVFMSSHIFEEIEDTCDRVAMILDGRIMDIVSLNEFMHPENKKFVITYKDGSIEEQQVPVSSLNAFFLSIKDKNVFSLSEKRKSLQDIFVEAYKKGAVKNEK